MRYLRALAMCLLLTAILAQTAVCENEPDWEGLALSCGTLVGVRCTNSGNELGNTYSAEIGWTEDATLALTVMESPSFDQSVTVSRYAAADDTLKRIAEIVNANSMTEWVDRPDFLSVCDASHPYLILEVMDDAYEITDYQISGYIEFTENESEAYDFVWSIVEESIQPDNLLETYRIEQ